MRYFFNFTFQSGTIQAISIAKTLIGKDNFTFQSGTIQAPTVEKIKLYTSIFTFQSGTIQARPLFLPHLHPRLLYIPIWYNSSPSPDKYIVRTIHLYIPIWYNSSHSPQRQAYKLSQPLHSNLVQFKPFQPRQLK